MTDALLVLAQQEKADLTVVGPELPLSLGVADRFAAAGAAATTKQATVVRSAPAQRRHARLAPAPSPPTSTLHG